MFRAERRSFAAPRTWIFHPKNPRMVAENEGFWLGFLTENIILVVTGILGGVDLASCSEIHILLFNRQNLARVTAFSSSRFVGPDSVHGQNPDGGNPEKQG